MYVAWQNLPLHMNLHPYFFYISNLHFWKNKTNKKKNKHDLDKIKT